MAVFFLYFFLGGGWFPFGRRLARPVPVHWRRQKYFQGSVQGFRVLFSHHVKNVDHLFELWGLPISNVTEIRIRDVKTV